MLQTVMTAAVGDDVMGEDPTVLELEGFMADKFGKERGLYVPTGTMANLVALLSHCDKTRAAEIIIGTGSHINLWEGGNAASIGGRCFRLCFSVTNNNSSLRMCLDFFCELHKLRIVQSRYPHETSRRACNHR